MPRAALCAVYSIILLAGITHGFSSSSLSRQTQTSSTTRLWATSKTEKDGSSSSDGAGSWRTKAKEFKENPDGFDGDDSDKKLNIAFVVRSRGTTLSLCATAHDRI